MLLDQPRKDDLPPPIDAKQERDDGVMPCPSL